MSLLATEPVCVPRRSGGVGIMGIGTATPPGMPQEISIRIAEELCCQTDEQRLWVKRIFSRCGVAHRGSVLAVGGEATVRDFFRPRVTPADRGPTTEERMLRYAAEAPPLAQRAALAALNDGRIDPASITHVVGASCTGFVAPGLDVELIQRLGLRADVQRVQIGFMGCHAAFNALNVAGKIAKADRNARVLVCCVELCSLHFAYGFDAQQLVANALFADGAAAAVVGSAGDGAAVAWELADSATLLIPDSRDAMTWRIGDHGFVMTLGPQVPELIRAHLSDWVGPWLRKNGLAIGDIRSWAIHPGGPKVVRAAAEVLDLPEHATDASMRVLSEHGNMSSATVLFVMQELAKMQGPCVALGFGPGLTAEAMLLFAD